MEPTKRHSEMGTSTEATPSMGGNSPMSTAWSVSSQPGLMTGTWTWSASVSPTSVQPDMDLVIRAGDAVTTSDGVLIANGSTNTVTCHIFVHQSQPVPKLAHLEIEKIEDQNGSTVFGVRSWTVDSTGKLRSPMRGTVWDSAFLEADNYDDTAAVEGNAGIHASRLDVSCARSSPIDMSSIVVYGLVERFGRYVLGDIGWRAERVIIRELWVGNPDFVEPLKQRYKVPVRLFDGEETLKLKYEDGQLITEDKDGHRENYQGGRPDGDASHDYACIAPDRHTTPEPADPGAFFARPPTQTAGAGLDIEMRDTQTWSAQISKTLTIVAIAAFAISFFDLLTHWLR